MPYPEDEAMSSRPVLQALSLLMLLAVLPSAAWPQQATPPAWRPSTCLSK